MDREIIPDEIAETPAAIQATIDETAPTAKRAAGIMHERQAQRIFLVGNGTSWYSSMAAAYTGRALSTANTLVLAMPAGDFRYYMPKLNGRDIVVGMSASGEFRDVLSIFQTLEGRALRVGITHVPDSSLTRLSDVTLLSGGGPSHAPVMTKTYASTLAAAHLLLMEFFEAGNSVYDALRSVPGLCAQALDQANPLIPELASEFSQYEHAFYFGAGCGYAAALETALKMKEMALLHAEGSETWEMASGPATIVGAHTFCAALYTGEATDASTGEVAGHAVQWQAPLLEVGPRAQHGGWHLPVPVSSFAPFASLTLVPPLALLAYRVARLRGANSRPAGLARALFIPGHEPHPGGITDGSKVCDRR